MKSIRQPMKRNEDIDFDRIQYRVAWDVFGNKIKLWEKEVLDFGAGNGEFSFLLRKRGCVVDCYEPDKDSRKALKEFNLPIVDKLTKKYDFIFLLDVIEHVTEPDKLLKKLKEHLKKNGQIIITTPDCNYWKYKVKHLLGDCSLFEYPHKHFVFFHERNLRELCSEYFEEVKLERFPYTLGYIGRNNGK